MEEEEGWELEFVKMRYHKEEQLNVGTECCLVKHCRTTRPAYVLSGMKNSKSKDLMYVYEPMGLYQQHDSQGSILVRFQDWNLALCFLEVAYIHLGVEYMDFAVTVPMTDDVTKQAKIRSEWTTLKAKYSIGPSSFSIEPDAVNLPEVEAWPGLINLLELISPEICSSYKEWMLIQAYNCDKVRKADA